MRRIFCLLLMASLLVGAVALAAPQGNIDRRSQELDDLRQSIRVQRSRAKGLATDERNRLKHVHAIEKEAGLVEDLLIKLAQQEFELQVRVGSLQAQADSSRALVATHQERLSRGLRTIYKRGRYPAMAVLAGVKDLQEIGLRLRFLNHVVRADRRVIDDVLAAQRNLRGQQGEMQQEIARMQANREEASQQRAQLQDLEDQANIEVAQLRRQRKNFENSATEMEKAATELESLLARLEQNAQDSALGRSLTGNLVADQGRLPWPAKGRVTRGFGPSEHPKFGTVVLNKGLNIAATEGTPILCVAQGIVEYVNWLPGYGRCIIVRHGGGYYTLYAHARALFPKVGQEVIAGDVLGEVGDTGSLEGSQLYFELRKGREALDPSGWLGRR